MKIDGLKIQEMDLIKIGLQVGSRLKLARLKEGLTQKELSKKSKVLKTYISKIEKGIKMISVGEAKNIAKVLKVKPEFLIAGD